MASTYKITPGDGVTKIFDVPFVYLDRSHVKVKVDGVDTPFEWLDDSRIIIDPAPAVGAKVRRSRETPITRIVDYSNGTVLNEELLDLDANQLSFVMQETLDGVTDTLQLNDVGVWDGKTIRVTNIATPLNGNDAVTKDYADAITNQVLGYRDEAETARDEAQEAATNAKNSETAAALSASNAETARAQAQTLANSMGRFEVKQLVSDYTIPLSENGYLYSVDASAGPVNIYLPLIADVGEPFTVRVKKVDNSINEVNVNFAGDDTINRQSLPLRFTTEGAGAMLASDIDPEPDNWGTTTFGASTKVSQRDYLFTASDGQTVFSGTDDNGAAFGYTVGAISVSVDGLQLVPGVDFSADDGTSLVFVEGLPQNAQVFVRAYSAFDVSDAITPAEVNELLTRVPNGEIGAVEAFAMQTPPNGWLTCDGSAVSRTAYADLFNVIGTTWGAGDGSTTFNLPDLRGEFLRGFDGGRGVDAGRAFGSWQADELKAHTHVVNYTGSSFAVAAGGSATTGVAPAGDSGSTGGSETRPRNVAVLYAIKAFHPVRILTSGAEGVSKSGDLMTGPLRLAGDAVLDDEAVTKRQLDVQLQAASLEHRGVPNNGGGTNVIGTWTARPVTYSENTIEGAIVDEAAGTITLPAGMTFRVGGYQMFHNTNNCDVRVKSLSGDVIEEVGASGYAYSSYHTSVNLSHRVFTFTTTQPTVLQMQYLTQTVMSGSGLGSNSYDSAASPVFAQLTIQRLA